MAKPEGHRGKGLRPRAPHLLRRGDSQALVKSFKLPFAKAERLKRTAAKSKYAKQVFQSMRPVFSDFVQVVQRSIGYYTALNREANFKRLIGLGNGFRLPGLQRFLEQNLDMPVSRVDAFNRLGVPPAYAEKFLPLVLQFATAYGLALQGLGLAPLTFNLMRRKRGILSRLLRR